MSMPQNNRKKAVRFRIISLMTGILLLFIILHIPKAWDGTPESITAILHHCVSHPFDVFPITKETWSYVFFVIPIVLLLMYQYFLEKRALRPGEESGSAGWNENIKKYYLTYADTVKFSIPKPKSEGVFKKMVYDFLVFIEKLLFGWTLKPNTKTGGTNGWEIERDDKGAVLSCKHNGTNNMILTKDVVLSMDTRKTFRNNNVLVIGGSGTGKSRFMIKPNMLQANSSYVITDPSGELLTSLGSFLKECGYDIKVFNLVQFQHSNCYNPFHYIRNEEGVLTMINALIKNTTPKGSNTQDPFWEKAETALLQALCFYLMEECNPEDQNFTSVMKLLRCAKAEEGREDEDSILDVLFKKLEARKPNHIACQSYAVFKSAGGGKTAQSILISCQTRLQVFNLDVIHKLTGTDDIDFKSIGDKPTVLFCITPVVDPTFNFLVALLYTQLFETLYFHAETECNDLFHKGQRLPVHVRFLLDEFANIGTIPEFDQKLATMRKYEISCTIVIQALSQLKAMYKDEWEVIVGNCDTLLFLGGTDKTTLEYMSAKLGKQTIRSKNTSRTYGRQGSSNTSFNTTGRELMTPDEISRMDNKNCIVFIRGELPFFSTKYDYPKHPNYKYTGDKNKSLEFNVKEMIMTGETSSELDESQFSKRTLLSKKAERTETQYPDAMEAQRRYLNRRNIEQQEKNKFIREKEEQSRAYEEMMKEKMMQPESVTDVKDEFVETQIYEEQQIQDEQERYVITEISSEFDDEEI